jgi:hypothetical protein
VNPFRIDGNIAAAARTMHAAARKFRFPITGPLP